MHIGLGWGNVRERDHLEDLSVDGKIICEWIFKEQDWVGMNWTDVARDKELKFQVL